MRFLRSPLLHFLVGGAVLLRLSNGLSSSNVHWAAPIVLTAADVERLRSEYTRETGLDPTANDEVALVDKAIGEELLFREAVARGLDRNDRSIRTWLIEQMEVLSEHENADPEALYARARALGLDRTDLVVRRILVQKMRLLAARTGERGPSEEQLRSFYADHRDDYAAPPLVSLWHVFFASATHGAATFDDARARLVDLRNRERAPGEAARESDSFTVPAHLVAQTPAQIEKLFGPRFAAEIGAAGAQTWIGPVASAYGAHLVWIERREPGAPPPFEAVRERLLERWQSEQRKRRVAALMRDLEARYPLRIESAAWQSRRAS
jgi:hypothetical protein